MTDLDSIDISANTPQKPVHVKIPCLSPKGFEWLCRNSLKKGKPAHALISELIEKRCVKDCLSRQKSRSQKKLVRKHS